jgi:regulatory protein YycI of two-component signal transduction system YycFG
MEKLSKIFIIAFILSSVVVYVNYMNKRNDYIMYHCESDTINRKVICN